MPEGHAIGRIDVGISIIPPATPGVGLVTAAIKHCSFPLSEVARRVGETAAGITNSGEHAGTGYRIADGGVSVLIDGDAGHPPPQPVIAIGPGLLLHRRCGEGAAGNIELIPANTCWADAGRVSANSTIRPQ